MARISKYTKDTGLTDKDLLVGSNYISGSLGEEIYETATFNLGEIKNYINQEESSGVSDGIITTNKQQIQIIFSPLQLNSFNNNSLYDIPIIEAPGEKKIIIVEKVHALKYFPTGSFSSETAYQFSDDLAVTVQGLIGVADSYQGHRVTIDNTSFLNNISANIGLTSVPSSVYGITSIQNLSSPQAFWNKPLKLQWKNQQITSTVGGNGSWSMVLLIEYSILDWSNIL